ncbi:MAG: S9 family peptidase, partial [Gammaproteobacteria bacterium]|nr:S9 family peptidase [Gammaproteobacteria bacterium]
MRIAHAATLLLLISACASPPPATPGNGTPPVAAARPHKVASPNGTRIDEYYWLRDDTRQSKQVRDYLNAENAWRETAMAHTAALQEQLYEELTGRLDPDESSVPEFSHGYWYYTRFEPGMEYPLYARRKGSLDAPEQVMLDGNRLAVGQPYFAIGATEVSPDGKSVAWTEDTVGRQQYTLRVKDLASGTTLPDSVANVEAGFIWAGDSRTLLYIAKNPVTLLSERVYRHALGTPGAADGLVYEEKDESFYL